MQQSKENIKTTSFGGFLSDSKQLEKMTGSRIIKRMKFHIFEENAHYCYGTMKGVTQQAINRALQLVNKMQIWHNQ